MAQESGAKRPPEKTSGESGQRQLDLAQEQGQTFGKAVRMMTSKVAHGAEKRAGDYLVGYAIEEAEGLYTFRDGRLEWHEPSTSNAHVEVVVRDGTDGRFVPNLTVYATLIDANGREIGTHPQPFLWHPWVYHYGRNWELPGDGTYTLRVHVDAPEFPRHDHKNGIRYAEPVDVEFPDVHVKTDQKKT